MALVFDFTRQTIVHSLCVLLFVEGLLRLWDLRGASQRLQLRLLAVFLPPIAYFLFAFLLPDSRRAESALGPVLLDTRTWLLANGTLGQALAWVLLALVGLAIGLFLLQLGFFLWQRGSASGQESHDGPRSAKLSRALARLRLRLAAPLPQVDVVGGSQPVVYTISSGCPRIVISSGLLSELDGDELLAALAHEVAHTSVVARRLRWLAWLGRAVSFYNPVSVIVLRQALHELEAHCDEQASRATGLGLACAAALLKVWPAAVERSAWAGSLSARLYARAEALQEQGEQAAVVDRAERLLSGLPSPWEAEWQWLRLVSTTLAALLMLGFVK